MKKFEYKFVEIPRNNGLKVKTGETFEACKQVIMEEAEQGWRLKQIVTPFNEKAGCTPLIAIRLSWKESCKGEKE